MSAEILKTFDIIRELDTTSHKIMNEINRFSIPASAKILWNTSLIIYQLQSDPDLFRYTSSVGPYRCLLA